MVKILLVDDDPSILALSESALRQHRPEWKIDATANPLAVGDLLLGRRYDVIISDYEMPKMRGDELLKAVQKMEPMTARFMLSSKIEIQQEIENFSIAHRFFRKPCDIPELVNAIERSAALRERLRGSRLRSVLNSITSLPSPPKTFFAIRQLLAKDGFHRQQLTELLRKEMSLASLMLKAANSSYYGARQRIDSIDRAVMMLGTSTIKSLVLGAELFSQIDARKRKFFAVDSLFDHSARVAAMAADMAMRRPETKSLRDVAYTAGLLHDVGKLVCIHALSEEYARVVKKASASGRSLYQEEIAAFGVSHQEIGAYVLTLWGIPEIVVEAVAFHHDPMLSPVKELSVLGLVAAANMIDRGLPEAISADEPNPVENYFSTLGMQSKDLLV